MPTPNPLRVAALRAAASLLAEAAEAMPDQPVSVELNDGFHSICIVVGPVPYSLVSQQQEEAAGNSSAGLRLLPVSEPEQPRLTPLDQLILASAPVDPVTLGRLARLAGNHDPDSYFQSRVRRLVQLGLMRRDFRGYRRA